MSSDLIVPAEPQAPSFFKDRRPWLIAFGIGLICIGLLSLLVAVITALSPLLMRNVPDRPPTPMGAFIFMGVFYTGVAAVFITMGVGSCMARNWARIGTLILSWAGLIMGVVMTLVTAFILPDVLKNTPQQPGADRDFLAGFMAGYVVFLCIFFVGVPLLYVIFYSTRNVRETCLAASNSRPLPPGRVLLTIIGIIFLLSLPGALMTTFMGPPVVLVFGIIIKGGPAIALSFLIAAVNLVAAWGFFKRDIRGWWPAIAITAFWGVSGIISIFAVDPADFWRAASPPGQAPIFSPTATRAMLSMGLLVWAALFGFIVYSRRYFPPLHAQARQA